MKGGGVQKLWSNLEKVQNRAYMAQSGTEIDTRVNFKQNNNYLYVLF